MRTTPWAALLLTLVLALAGCSSGDDDPAESGGPAGETASEPIATDAALGVVKGALSDAAAAAVLAEVTQVVDRWFDNAYVGDYPREKFDTAFADFTKDARGLAVQQAAILSNADLGADLEAVEATQRVVRVDVLVPKGKLAGATVRFRLVIAMTGAVERTDRVTGRLMLTPVAGGWQVFGFDVQRDEEGS
ncbi:hypothetical protein [Nocardioides sp. WS12]|uniref:hypothetical protein n=1 Tax=Nocardioides sp. WS12 TaxID=2486272 RepID=UPI0015F78F83|nr:hypothetical protein [Nocardioides sp. WS12]